MALVQRGALRVIYTYRDKTGSIGKGEAFLPSITTLADAKTLADALMAELQTASDCSVLSYNVVASFIETAPVAAVSGSRVENKGVFQFRTAAGKLTKLTVPGIKAALVNDAGGIISTATPAAAIVGTMTTSAWCDSNGSDVVSLYADYQRFSSTTKRQMTSDSAPEA